MSCSYDQWLQWAIVYGAAKTSGGGGGAVDSIELVDPAGTPINATGDVSITGDNIQSGSYTPTNFTPAAESGTFPVNSISAMFKGIDAAIATGGGVPIAQLVWVNAADGVDDIGRGSIDAPYATYAYAVSQVSAIASATNIVIIKMIGDFSITGSLQLYPFIFIDCEGSGIITLSNQLTANTAFNSTPNAFVSVRNAQINAAGGYNLQMTTAQNQVVQFLNVNPGNTPDFEMAGADSATGATLIWVSPLASGGGNFFFTVENVFLIARNLQSSNFKFFNTSATHSKNVVLDNVSFGPSLIEADSGGTTTANIQNSKLTSLDLGGTGVTVQVDASSYNFNLLFTSGADVSQIELLSSANGSRVDTTPTAYTPAPPTANTPVDSVTSHLNGIDNALSVLNNNVIAIGEAYFQGNTTATTITAANTPVEVAGTYSSGKLVNFTRTGGVLTYTGPDPVTVLAFATLTAKYDSTSQDTKFYIALNGTPIAKTGKTVFIGPTTQAPIADPCKGYVDLVTNDTLSVYVENLENDNDPIVVDLNLGANTVNAVIADSSPTTVDLAYGEMFIAPVNTLATTITASAWTKVSAGSGSAPDFSFYNAGALKEFSFSNGRLTYTGADPITVKATVSGSGFLSTGTAELINYILFKNGNTAITGSSLGATIFPVGTSTNAATAVTCQGTFELVTGDYLELFTRNTSVANPIFKYANVIVDEI